METRKESLGSLKVCRFCLTTDESLTPLYDNKVRTQRNTVPFALKILACMAIEIFPSDKMPQYICQRCKLFMDLSYAFKQICRHADEAILQYIQKGTTLAPMSWPAQLNKVFKATNKPTELNVKTVVQGGATVKVMAEEVSDSEEGDDENVYNVKIGDGSEECKNIKVITSIDKQSQPAARKGRQGTSKNPEEADSLEVSQLENNCWACQECERTYPLQQLLTLHMAQKHRVRNKICDECGRKFFSKYDLDVHKLTHSSETPFQCVACKKKFKRLLLLKRHEKIMHSEMPQQSCTNCPATFLSTEELEAHKDKHKQIKVQPYNCSICNQRFHQKFMLEKHTLLVHSKKSAYSCQYCKEQFPGTAKLVRHVREHAGMRPFPCKHCDKSFVKSHHYTRHIRIKHGTTIRTAGTYNEADAYRCDECEDTFATQDDLMYHSAVHATKNLICPLCQEKFDDVDTVTAHIKSHGHGREFMCDFCELIFTSKDKLENHIARSHDEELLANEQDTENDESSMDVDAEDEYDDNSINVKEVDGHMVVEIKKAEEYMLPAVRDEEDKTDNTQSEDSDTAYTDSPVTEVEAIEHKQQLVSVPKEVTITKLRNVVPKETAAPNKTEGVEIQPSNIVQKGEEINRKTFVVQRQQSPASVPDKKEKTINKGENSSAATGASNKSLRLLEKELQDLKRTNTRAEVVKTPVRTAESLRNRRPQLYSSTPKIRTVEKKEVGLVEKKAPERKVTKDLKEPKEAKNNSTIKEDKETKGNAKEEVAKEEKKEVKEKETPKVVKNGTSEASAATVEDPIRRSTRPSKIKDYAKMIRDSSMDSDEDDSEQEEEEEEEEDEDEEEYKEPEKTPETTRVRSRRGSTKQTQAAPPTKPAAPAVTPVKGSTPRKRGRPRKERQTAVPSKIRKDEPSEEDADPVPAKSDGPAPRISPPKDNATKETEANDIVEGSKTPEKIKLPPEPKPGTIISPSGQTLKKVPVRSLPPGVKPLPLPVNSRLGGGEVCEMQIGKKMVKVQKIVMTKAEVEAMAKKGLLEMKDGTMVLKQGIKLTDPGSLKSSLVMDGEQKKESPLKHVKPAPTRCDLE